MVMTSEPFNNNLSASEKTWMSLHKAFDYFNKVLFNDLLPRDKVVLNCSRKTRCLGFYRDESWRNEFSANNDDNVVAEISLNPDYMEESLDKIYSTLVHEMTHFEQFLFGTPGKSGYHNAEWAGMMLKVGLKPFSLRDPSKMTGPKCSHEIIKEGVFDKAMKTIPDDCKLPFKGIFHAKPQSKNLGYVRYMCPTCSLVVRGKPNIRISCLDCDCELEMN